jgi:hypothetical protein
MGSLRDIYFRTFLTAREVRPFQRDRAWIRSLRNRYLQRERKGKEMGSKGKEARLEQERYWDEKLKERVSLLAEKGLDADGIAKDVTVRKLRAKIRETGSRLRAIQGKEEKAEEMARTKAEKLAAPKVKKSGKKKETEEKPAESKRQQKKKKKKEGQTKE